MPVLESVAFHPAVSSSEEPALAQPPDAALGSAEYYKAAQKRYRERQKGIKRARADEAELLHAELEAVCAKKEWLQCRILELESSLRNAVPQLYLPPEDRPAEALQEQLCRQGADERIQPLLLEEGKLAVLNLNGPFIFNRRHIAELTLKQYVDMKKGLVRDMHCKLHCASQARKNSVEASELQEAVGVYMFVTGNVDELNFELARESSLVDMDSMQPLQSLPDERWAPVLDLLHLSVDQKRDLARASHEYMAVLRSLVDVQRRWAGPSQVALSIESESTYGFFLSELACSTVKFSEAVRAEEKACLAMTRTVYTQVLRAHQGDGAMSSRMGRQSSCGSRPDGPASLHFSQLPPSVHSSEPVGAEPPSKASQRASISSGTNLSAAIRNPHRVSAAFGHLCFSLGVRPTED
ncbi:hypothetical protein WJX84_011749 [Apatococcus fuscideae]|uniref:Uncharacterized protein n=1 Tax=Apatococcus fuscideae TaxID=2026836 RepID=A0AAW1SC39_9CHLO